MKNNCIDTMVIFTNSLSMLYRTVFSVLYTLLSFGHSSPEESEKLDPPTNYFRVRLVATVLAACGHYFSKGSAKAKLDKYLVYFQRYLLFKPPLPIEVDFTVQVLHPSLAQALVYAIMIMIMIMITIMIMTIMIMIMTMMMMILEIIIVTMMMMKLTESVYAVDTYIKVSNLFVIVRQLTGNCIAFLVLMWYQKFCLLEVALGWSLSSQLLQHILRCDDLTWCLLKYLNLPLCTSTCQTSWSHQFSCDSLLSNGKQSSNDTPRVLVALTYNLIKFSLTLIVVWVPIHRRIWTFHRSFWSISDLTWKGFKAMKKQ